MYHVLLLVALFTLVIYVVSIGSSLHRLAEHHEKFAPDEGAVPSSLVQELERCRTRLHKLEGSDATVQLLSELVRAVAGPEVQETAELRERSSTLKLGAADTLATST